MADKIAQQALDRALDESHQLLLLYQPIHDARSSVIYGAEALLRQRRESGEIREASIIAEAAEERGGGELFALDSVIMRKAYNEAARWPGEIRLNVNLSPREFQEGRVIERLTALVTTCGIDTRRVNLEITETSYIERPRETEEVLRAMKALGAGLWLDDFGTGHSSIAHLLHFPLDGLKIPGAFVRPLAHDSRSRAIARTLIALAHDLGMRVIAEEVETSAQLDMLLEWDCDYIQGFLFSQPMEADAFAALLRT